MLCLPVLLVVVLPGSFVHLLGGRCLFGPVECLRLGDMTCLLVAIAGVREDHNGLRTTISEVLLLPDLIIFLVAVTSLVVGRLGWWLVQNESLQV